MSMVSPARKTVVVIGGGYGGITAAKSLDDVADVVLVEPKDAFVHNVAALRALVDPAWLPRIYLPYDGLLASGRVVRDRAAKADAGRVTLASGAELEADYIVLATGSQYPFPAKTMSTVQSPLSSRSAQPTGRSRPRGGCCCSAPGRSVSSWRARSRPAGRTST